ncbi:unnamed protein product [Peronospora belbahrii]|uniref:Uncharacterized protein n=1 Tax=Peronospora belbahrii TaxID=622444 RepID=A0AAU9KZ37_9STRA|nr:unnamed protein product [Peronospora belbahrii]
MSRRLVLLLVFSMLLSVSTAIDRTIQLKTDQLVTVKLADGTTRELTAAEFEKLVKERGEIHTTLQDNHDKIQADDQVHWQRQELEQTKTQDPQFALHIDLARRAFKEIQRHGYAQGYLLAGFSEQDTSKVTVDYYYVELILQAKKGLSTGVVAKTGTGTRKVENEGEEMPLFYEVQLLLDVEKRFSVVAAWELSEKEPLRGQRRARVIQLTIQPTAALLERKAERARNKPAMAIWLLSGGLGLVAVGLLVMYHTRNPIPAPKPRRRSSDMWELVDEKDNPIKTNKLDKKND